MNTTKPITQTDLIRIEASLKKLIKATKSNKLEKEYFTLLNKMADSINEIKLIVEFDHESRIQAIEDYLQQFG